MPAQFDLQNHHRHSIRLNGYDYTQAGAYFLTIVTWQRNCLFGEVVNGEMQLNALGDIARREWFKTAALRANVELYEDEFVVMPNNVHGIVWIVDGDVGAHIVGAPVGAQRRCAPTMTTPRVPSIVPQSLGAIIRAYKSAVTYAINAQRDSRRVPVWQRNYYEHILRGEQDYQRIVNYILNNPLQWENDNENLQRKK